MTNSKEFSVAHYTGKVAYDASDMPDKNRDFLPPEMIETMRQSSHEIVKQLFSGLLTKTGNLTISSKAKLSWKGALVAEKENQRSRVGYCLKKFSNVCDAVCLDYDLFFRNITQSPEGNILNRGK